MSIWCPKPGVVAKKLIEWVGMGTWEALFTVARGKRALTADAAALSAAVDGAASAITGRSCRWQGGRWRRV